MAVRTDLLQVVDQVNGPSESRNHHPHPQLKLFGERQSATYSGLGTAKGAGRRVSKEGFLPR